jgi:hypothetical protein
MVGVGHFFKIAMSVGYLTFLLLCIVGRHFRHSSTFLGRKQRCWSALQPKKAMSAISVVRRADGTFNRIKAMLVGIMGGTAVSFFGLVRRGAIMGFTG